MPLSEPKPSLKKVIEIMDRVNPYVVFVSVIGLLLEFTQYKQYVVRFNSYIDIFFVLDFLVRLFAYPPKQYFIHGYGWVDFLAALPGFTFIFEQIPGFFKIFKILRIGRFFKIVRILRFLRIFSFLKKMKSDSPYIQERIMKIGVVIVLTMVVGIGSMDYYLDKGYVTDKQRSVKILLEQNMPLYRALDLVFPEELRGYKVGEAYFSGDHQTMQEKDFEALSNTQNDAIILYLNDSDRAIIFSQRYLNEKNNVMLSMVLSLIAMIVIVIFYIGYILAKDIKIVNLIVDSVDADDYMLLQSEGQNYQEADGSYVINPQDEELLNLLKIMNKLVADKNLTGGEIGVEAPYNFERSTRLDTDPSIPSDEISDDMLSDVDHAFKHSSAGLSYEDIIELFHRNNLELKEELRSLISHSNIGAATPIPLDTPIPSLDGSINSYEVQNILNTTNEELKKDLIGIIQKAQRDIALESVKLASKGIVNYIKKNLK